MNRLLRMYLPRLISGSAILHPQGDGEPTYYPKRTPEDGIIDWNKGTLEINNLIRAVTKPFPGAFSFLDGEKVMIWRAQPFDERLRYDDHKPGQILEVFTNGNFLVKTGDSTLLITESEGSNDLIMKGRVFTSLS